MRRSTLALYHLHLKNISRADGSPERPRSVLAAAAYRAGETLWNEAEEKESAFGGRRDVVMAEIRLPAGAPAWMADRATLWNAVEAAEKRRDARLAKEVEFSLPRELPRGDWVTAAREMADAYTSQGFVVDLAIHDDGTQHNPHVHMLLTTRVVTDVGFGGKRREADGKPFLVQMRRVWESIANQALARAGISTTIDARSHAARGIEREPGQHQGPDPAARRARREQAYQERADPMTPAMKDALRELLAEEGIRDRYPVLSAREDWPPTEPGRADILATRESTERLRFWNEVQERATGARARDGEEHDAPRRNVDVLWRQVEDLSRDPGEGGASLLDAARDRLAGIRDALTDRMVSAGLLEPRTAEQLRALENRLYRDEFSRMRAEAQRLEAKRREIGEMPRATPQQLRELERHERAEELRLHDEYEARRRGGQEPDPDGAPIASAALDAASAAMLREVESPAPVPGGEGTESERVLAENAMLRMADLPVPEQEADAYRIAPQEHREGWLEEPARVPAAEPKDREGVMGWMKGQIRAPTHLSEEPARSPERQPEPERKSGVMDWMRRRVAGGDRTDGPERDQEPSRDPRR